MALLIYGLQSEIGNAQGWRDTFAELLPGLDLRIFPDAEGKMNRNVVDVAGGLLLVPQFTLAADTRSGTRPSFTPAAAPDDARRLFDYFLAQARKLHATVAAGVFGAHMEVSLTNDGPVTFWLQVKPVEIVA